MEKMRITKDDLQKMLIYTAHLLKDNSPSLSDIDSRFGDGDHGITIGKIAGCMEQAEKNWTTEPVAEFLDDMGVEIMNVNGGSAGPLWGTLFQGFSSGICDEDTLDADGIKNMICAGIEEMKTITTAGAGDKTMMDPLICIGERLKNLRTDSVECVLKESFDAANQGMENTKNYVAKFGRAKSYGKETIGCPDAGAMGIMFLFKGLYEGYIS